MSATRFSSESPAAADASGLSILERLKLIRELATVKTDLKSAGAGPLAAVKRLKLVARANEIRIRLGGAESPLADDDDGLSDDPSSANYRYKDTGYIADSRKERAAGMIHLARQSGRRVRVSDIDWKAIEQNPRQAAELITKSNLFGKTDWESLQQAGMEPAAGFLIEKIYASIGAEPTTALPKVTVQALSGGGLSDAKDLERSGVLDRDSPDAMAQTRRDYALGLETIRERLEKALTVDAVLAVLSEIKDELTGVTLSAEQADMVAALETQYLDKRTFAKSEMAKKNEVYLAWRKIQQELQALRSDQANRARRKWKPDPDIDQKIAEIVPSEAAAEKAFHDYLGAHPELENKKREYAGGGFNYLNDLEFEADQFAREIQAIRRQARYLNLLSNTATRAWLSFGERFFRLLNYRSFRGSDAFGAHVTSARMDKIKDWSWADKEKPAPTPRKPTEESINFQLRVAETFERRGGKEVTVSSTQALKDMMGFRDVQSGNWVLRDPASAKFHVEQTAAAVSDMADILGIDMKYLGLGGRLGMAFGARGSGGKGAARAHYEPVHRVVNLTKMGGGGALGHELLHAIDNILPSLVNGTPGGKGEFASADPTLLPAGRVRDAFAAVREAISSGNTRLTETIRFTDKDRATAKLNIDRSYLNAVAKLIKDAGSIEPAVLAVDGYFAGRTDKRSLRNAKQWRTLAAAYWAEEGKESITLQSGRAVSSFMAGAQALDAGSVGKYWSSYEEMAARAFQSYLEDRLADQNRRNDYLSALADNKYHVDPLFGIEWKPYPEGDERTRINAAFDALFEVLRDEKVFEKATGNAALLDSIFGVMAEEDADDIVFDGTEGNDLTNIEAAKTYWDSQFAGKILTVSVQSGSRNIQAKVRFNAGNDHAYTSGKGAREFDLKRAQAMPRLFSVIEHPQKRIVGPGGADLLLERRINGEHYTVVLTWRDAAAVYEFQSAHFKSAREVAELLKNQTRRNNKGPLQR